jgi:putative photosynthetic complex assembly protein 2
MNNIALAAVFGVFIWWFSTGVVLLLNGMQRRAYRWSLLASTVLGATALWALAHTAHQTDTAGVYCAFTSALLVWGWHELSFLTGWITGPRTTAIPRTLSGWPRFVQSVRALLWHELGILAVGLFIVYITWGAPNQTGTWTFLVLWVMRTSAKLNLFLGVRNLSEEFLPPHLAYLESFFRRRAMNWLLPLSLAVSGAFLGWMVVVALAPQTTDTEVLRLTLVGTLLAMAIVEHAMLVLPLSTTALWRWAMGSREHRTQGRTNDRTNDRTQGRTHGRTHGRPQGHHDSSSDAGAPVAVAPGP